MIMLLPTPSYLPLTKFAVRQIDLTTTIVVADTGRNLKEVVAAPQALVVAAESEVEVEHTLVEVEVELTVLNLKTS